MTQTPDPDPVLVAIERLRADLRGGLRDIRQVIVRQGQRSQTDLQAIRRDLVELRGEVTQVGDAVADVASRVPLDDE